MNATLVNAVKDADQDAVSFGSGIDRLLRIMARLRGPGGCPWDHEQTVESLRPCLMEEAYELLEAIDSGDTQRHAEELGDVLLQVVFQARIREEEGHFDFDAVAHRLADKLVRRHPHVFGDVDVRDSGEVLRNWEAIKREEREGEMRSALAGVPSELPALLRAQRVQSKAARVGFDWPDADGADRKIDEERAELREALTGDDPEAVRHEVGDLLFSVVNLCRHIGVDAETTLREAVDRFAKRFRAIEARVHAGGGDLRDCSLETLDAHWDAVKRERGEPG